MPSRAIQSSQIEKMAIQRYGLRAAWKKIPPAIRRIVPRI
jgi:hypothetical protein